MYTDQENQAPTTTRKRVASSSQAMDNAAPERHKQQVSRCPAPRSTSEMNVADSESNVYSWKI